MTVMFRGSADAVLQTLKRARDCKSLTDYDLNPTITHSSSELLELLQPGKVENALARVVEIISPDYQYDSIITIGS